MRIGCLQFAAKVGEIKDNIALADRILANASPKNLDLLVLPELAFTGYNFKSLHAIAPFLEPTAAGPSATWANATAQNLNCAVVVGYPETVDVSKKWPTSPEYYNAAVAVSPSGATLANYRKSFLFYTDETWALEGPDGFFGGEFDGIGNVAMGICMDLNPYKFEAPWSDWEFAYHILHVEARVAIVSMAWNTREEKETYVATPKEPDMETLAYWVARLEPLVRREEKGEIIVVLANRCGVEDDAVYVGTSTVLGIEEGEVKLYGVLGRGVEELLVVDTEKGPLGKLVSVPRAAEPIERDVSTREESVESLLSSGLDEKEGNGGDKSSSAETSVSPGKSVSPH
jgi:predicted amidohydrolase